MNKRPAAVVIFCRRRPHSGRVARYLLSKADVLGRTLRSPWDKGRIAKIRSLVGNTSIFAQRDIFLGRARVGGIQSRRGPSSRRDPEKVPVVEHRSNYFLATGIE